MFADLSVLYCRRCPWYLKCVVMYARYSFIMYMRWVAEAELLFLFWTWSIFRGRFLLALCIWLLNHSVVRIGLRPPSPVLAIELAGLLEDPTNSIVMIGWFIGVAVYLAGSV